MRDVCVKNPFVKVLDRFKSFFTSQWFFWSIVYKTLSRRNKELLYAAKLIVIFLGGVTKIKRVMYLRLAHSCTYGLLIKFIRVGTCCQKVVGGGLTEGIIITTVIKVISGAFL